MNLPVAVLGNRQGDRPVAVLVEGRQRGDSELNLDRRELVLSTDRVSTAVITGFRYVVDHHHRWLLRPRAERTDETLHELSGLLVVDRIPSMQRHCVGYTIKNHEIRRLDPRAEAIGSTRRERLGWRHVAETIEDQLIRYSKNLEPAYDGFGSVLEVEIQDDRACRQHPS